MYLKELKQLEKAYLAAINNRQKSFFSDKSCGFSLFVEYLRYLRDYSILTKYDATDEATKVMIATVTAAVAEFDAYINESDVTHKKFHWNNFCELLKQNMEDWLKLNDSI